MNAWRALWKKWRGGGLHKRFFNCRIDDAIAAGAKIILMAGGGGSVTIADAPDEEIMKGRFLNWIFAASAAAMVLVVVAEGATKEGKSALKPSDLFRTTN